ncbi:MAG TPA: AAA family ATPase [Mycobacteriales bacterium]|nr:AAA family ATPase [Mycobacteriales bacterium]
MSIVEDGRDSISRKLADSQTTGLATLPKLSEDEGGLGIAPVGGATRAVAVQLIERGVAQPIELADASFGTVRLLALLAALQEPHPAPFLAVEEIDHGLHPYALDVLVDRLRAASGRTQILAAAHSPTLLNRLEPEEIVVCDCDPDTGASIISAVSTAQVRAALTASEWRAGELWLSGAIRGVPA